MHDVTSIAALQESLQQLDYVAERGLATAIYLATKMRRPLFLEGEAGVGADGQLAGQDGGCRARGAGAGILGATALGLVASVFGGTRRLISAPCAPAAASGPSCW